MPLYEYACAKCGHRFDYLARSMSEPPPKCPACSSKKTKKEPSVFSARVEPGTSSSCSTGACPTGTCPLD